MIVTVGNIKGGVGKTTLAANLAIARAAAGRDVLLVDGDEQETAMQFSQLRQENLGSTGYTVIALRGAALRSEIRKLASKYQDIVIDVGGRDTGSLRAALTITDTLVVPVQPRSFDIWAVDQLAALVKEAREINETLRAVSILNGADAQGPDNAEAAAALAEIPGIDHLPAMIVRRKAFPNAASQGRSVLELSPRDPKAVEELTAIVSALFV